MEVQGLPNGTLVRSATAPKSTRCMYRGKVRLTARVMLYYTSVYNSCGLIHVQAFVGSDESHAIVSLCNSRIHATIYATDGVFEIHHIPSETRQTYIAYRLRDYNIPGGATCGVISPSDTSGRSLVYISLLLILSRILFFTEINFVTLLGRCARAPHWQGFFFIPFGSIT